MLTQVSDKCIQAACFRVRKLRIRIVLPAVNLLVVSALFALGFMYILQGRKKQTAESNPDASRCNPQMYSCWVSGRQ